MMKLGEIKVLNMTFRIEHILIVGILGSIMYMTTIYSCKKVGFREGLQMLGSTLDYDMSNGVEKAWNKDNVVDGVWNVEKENNEGKSHLVKPNNMMSFFNETTFSPECCPSAYTSRGGLNTNGVVSKGCACMNKEQSNYLNQRGGNRVSINDEL